MTDGKSQKDKFIKAAKKMMTFAKNTILVNLRFFNTAVYKLPVRVLDTWDLENTNKIYSQDIGNTGFGTDGSRLFYQPEYLITCYKKEANLPARMYLHSMLHCIFLHFYTPYDIKKRLWDLACDISVEAVISELELGCFKTERDEAILDETWKFKEELPNLTAERIYKYLKERDISDEELERLEALFSFDEHSLWYPKEKKEPDENPESVDSETSGAEEKESEERYETPEGSNASSENAETPDDSETKAEKQKGSALEEELEALEIREKERLDESRSDWKKISLEMQIELETFLKDKGEKAGVMIQNLRAVNRETYDYGKFLEKFAVLGEAMQMNDEEFDYIFYTYGLNLYGDVPLIEPLEYRDVKRIKDFVIVIDTSGSTKGDLVQAFVQKTFNILKQQEHFHQKMNLHIIQCDAKVQEDVKITSQAELDQYLREMKILGQGGTDFRPAFAYVDELVSKGEFENLQGLIYFTDGYGTFPKKQPDYKVAVVFVEEDYENPDVPVWAIKLVLRPEEICDEY